MADKPFQQWLTDEISRRPGVTGGMLAEQAGISRASAYAYLNGTRTPSTEAVNKIVDALKSFDR